MHNDQPESLGCLSERQLVAVATGDAPALLRAHARACAACTGRLAAIEDDLSAIVTALRSGGAPARPAPFSRRRVWLGATAAAAALAIVALGLGLRVRTTVSPPSPSREQRAFLESISGSMFVARDYDRMLQAPRQPAFDAARACAWGSLSMPCTIAAWGGDEESDAR